MIPPQSIAAAAESGDAGLRRFARHLALPGFGVEAQRALAQSSVLMIGAGGLGSPALYYLAAAGVGHITIIDPDHVSESNLQRQILYTVDDIGMAKAEVAARRLRRLWPAIQVTPHVEHFHAKNAPGLAASADVVVDGSDTFATRYLTSDVCTWVRKPNVYASIFRYEGQISVFAPHLDAPCYRCIFPQPPPPHTVPSCADGGVLGALPGVVGSMQAVEAIKLLTGVGTPLLGRLSHVDLRAMRFREIKMRRDPLCPVCGPHPTIREPIDYDGFCGVRPAIGAIEEDSLRRDLAQRPPGLTILDVREPWEATLEDWPHADLAIPWSLLPQRLAELPPVGRLIIVCREGRRSAHAATFLHDAGFTHTAWLRTGLMDWV